MPVPVASIRPSLWSRIRPKLLSVLLITVAWSFISMVLFLQGYTALIQFGCLVVGLNASDFLVGALITSVTAGLTGGSMIVFAWERWLRSLPYNRALLLIFITYTIAFVIVDAITSAYLRATAPEFAPGYFEHLFDWQNLAGFFVWLVIVVVTLIALLVNDKYGPGVFRAFIMGKYFQPTREERTVMFLDLRGSTAIAEYLGEELFFRFIRDVFRHATPPMLRFGAEIYQYVGDEVILTWRNTSGLTDQRCVACFYGVAAALENASAHFRTSYGVVPEFKAGLHHGSVMVGEVGIVKRDIAYSGDVMNTTARIQAKCNDLGVNLLMSGEVVGRFANGATTDPPRQLGVVRLRGKREQVPLYTV